MMHVSTNAKRMASVSPNDPKMLSDVTQTDTLYTTGLSCKVLFNVVTVKTFIVQFITS